jgi:hypothetical protein
LAFFLSVFYLSGQARAQTPPPSENTNSGQTEASLGAQTAINAILDSSVDSKKAKQGDIVKAHAAETVKSPDNRTIVPKGAKLIGHITQVASRSKGDSDSMLGIQFDKAEVKGGQEVPLGNLMVQAVAPPATTAASYSSPAGSTAPSGTASSNPSMSGSRGGATPTPSPNPGAQQPDSTGDASMSGPLPPNARGVYGLEGLSLARNSSNGETVITSKGKNVHLDSGTRLLLAPQQQASAAPGQ